MNEIEEPQGSAPSGENFEESREYSPSAGSPSVAAHGAMPDQRPANDPTAGAVPVSGSNMSATEGDKNVFTDRDSLIETAKTVVYALLIALVIRTFLFQPFNIPSGSMIETLLVGDYLFVEKFAYGYSRYSFPWGLGPIPNGRIWPGNGPHRGDVIVFKLPSDNSTDYIKRLIGLPGDRIQIISGQIYLNDRPVPRVRVADYVTDNVIDVCGGSTDMSRTQFDHIPRYRETLPGGKSYDVLACDSSKPANNTGVYTVPPGHYFMMGDNRDNSLDSRFFPVGEPFLREGDGGVGYVPAANLVGKAEFIFFSNDGTGWEILEFWKWPWTVRFSRIFKFVD